MRCNNQSNFLPHVDTKFWILRTHSVLEYPEDIRLADSYHSDTAVTGRVEVRIRGEWGTVCDDVIDTSTAGATVICKSLGYEIGTRRSDSRAGQGRIALDDVDCSGDERSIFDCRAREPFETDCGHTEDFVVQCDREYSEKYDTVVSIEVNRLNFIFFYRLYRNRHH